MQEVARGTMLAFALKIMGSGLAFAFNVVVARLLGAEGAGIYFLSLAVTTIASVIGRVGLDNALLRFIATGVAKHNWGKVIGVYKLGMRIAVLVSGSLTFFLFIAAPWMATAVFKKPELSEPLRWMSLSILPFALLNLQAESLKGLKRIRDAMMVQGVGVPLFSLIAVLPLVKSTGVLGVCQAYLIATLIVAMLGLWFWRKAIPEQDSSCTSGISISMLWQSSRPLFFVSVMNSAILPWVPLFLLGIWVSSEAVGVFGAAFRVAMLVSFMLGTINNVVAPKFAELYAQENIKALGNTARHSALIIILLTSPIFIVLIFGGDWVMGIYGKEFEQGGLVLSVLAVGQFINLLTGSVGYLLMMSGNEKIMQDLTIVSTIAMTVLSVLLIPQLGILGAAIATSIAVAVSNLGAAWEAKQKLGIQTIPFLRG